MRHDLRIICCNGRVLVSTCIATATDDLINALCVTKEHVQNHRYGDVYIFLATWAQEVARQMRNDMGRRKWRRRRRFTRSVDGNRGRRKTVGH